MELTVIFKALLSLGIVFLAMYFILKLVQKYTKFGFRENSKIVGSLKIENVVYVDENTKIINISNNNGYSYVIAINKNNTFLIDKYKTNINNE
ncbi:MAG: hypothetical protein EKK61_02075 [Rickettsiales bacterium]|nr:MAG: hypothetical protein EKK61_02075 [Rickettsiales bacterium]